MVIRKFLPSVLILLLANRILVLRHALQWEWVKPPFATEF